MINGNTSQRMINIYSRISIDSSAWMVKVVSGRIRDVV